MMIQFNSLGIPSFFPFFHGKENSSSIQKPETLQKFTQLLASDQCSFDQLFEWKEELKNILLNGQDSNELDQFFKKMTAWGVEKEPQRIMSLLSEVISLETLEKIIQFKSGNSLTSAIDLAKKNVLDCPNFSDSSLSGQLCAEWKVYRPIIIYFIPNLLNIFLGAFNFLDSNKKFSTLWEKHLLLEIIYKFFVIPYCLIQMLQPVLQVPAKVYCVAAMIIMVSGVLISIYQRRFRPVPDEIINCENLDKQMEQGIIDPTVTEPQQIDQLIAALTAHNAILLIGRSGEGKTALIHHLIQLKHQKKLPQKLQELSFFEADCGLMISNLTFGHSELINQTKEQMRGFDDKILLFFDEFYQLAENKGAYLAFKKRFLRDQPQSKCVLAVTLKEWDKLKELDTDYSFRSRIYRMKIGESSDDHVRKIVKNYLIHFARDVPISVDAVDKVLELSTVNNNSLDVGRPAKAEELLKTAIGWSRAALDHHYGPIQIDEGLLEKNYAGIEKLKRTLVKRDQFQREYYRLSHRIAGEKIDSSISQKDKLLYLWYCFYAKEIIEDKIKEELKEIDQKIPVDVNAALIQRAFDYIKEIEESLDG